MNVKYINPLMEATLDVLSTMAKTTGTPGRPGLKKTTEALGDVTGLIALTGGSDVHGSLAISFPSAVILTIHERMLGETHTNIDESIKDLVGEITNMITGGAKRRYEEAGLDFALTQPVIIMGRETPIEHHIEGMTIMVPFESDAGVFFIEFRFA
jgi:chemotaxis protein CheX